MKTEITIQMAQHLNQIPTAIIPTIPTKSTASKNHRTNQNYQPTAVDTISIFVHQKLKPRDMRLDMLLETLN